MVVIIYPAQHWLQRLSSQLPSGFAQQTSTEKWESEAPHSCTGSSLTEITFQGWREKILEMQILGLPARKWHVNICLLYDKCLFTEVISATVKYERVLCSKAVQMRISAHSRAEEEKLLNAATSSLPKAQEHVATLFAGLNQSLIPPKCWGLTSTLPEKSSAHCTNTTQHIYSHGRLKMKTLTHGSPFWVK